ncbi:hypothetical protein Tco_1042421 [Tanacetum coccineum]|uniref:Reverse transcriptase Ty1/copia-type domain-containing protein n=1 Tax=Tanacetum coccineum TaxID=301880 RepID=A0ABQ5GJD3_9ASTR
MFTLAEFMIVSGADNRPPMLDKPQYESWKIRMELYIQEDGTIRLKTYEELSDKEKLQADCDLKATNIVLQGLPPNFYALVNHNKIAKDIWDRVKLLMQGTSLSRQEREFNLYDEFDKFSYVKGETLYQYYLRFAQLINDINIIQMTMQPVQVNTKFLNSLPLEWGKFVTNVKLERDMHTSNYDQLYAFLEEHKAYANEARLMRERFPDPLALMSIMGKKSFFLGLQIPQSPRGIFLNQSKYALEIIKKYGMETSDPVDTPMVEKSKLDADPQKKEVDPIRYRRMIGSLMNLTASRPDLQFVVCMCARYQAKPTEKHLHAVKRIFIYLKGTINMGMWYSKDSCIALSAFADAHHAGCQDTRRITYESMQLLGDRLVSWSSKKQNCTAISSIEAEYIALYYFIKEQVENGVVELYFVRTEYQLADIFTKALGRE